jgi:hypothetical protein
VLTHYPTCQHCGVLLEHHKPETLLAHEEAKRMRDAASHYEILKRDSDRKLRFTRERRKAATKLRRTRSEGPADPCRSGAA